MGAAPIETVHVELGDRSYPIKIGPGASEMLRECIGSLAAARQIVVIADQTVSDLHYQRLAMSLPENALLVTFPPGEASKSLDAMATIYDQLARARIERSAIIIAFGGGVTGDLAGFIAASWLRGVRFVQVPTTLLAAVDSSVGGKTGVNLPAGKNLIGAFHQPQAVVIDTDFLKTLPKREYASGLAESAKHGMIRDADFVTWHEEHAAALEQLEPAELTALIARNCAIKADVVSQDEREAGLRAILNFGHTIGHAIEHLLGYELRHGECVALGMIAENEIARVRGRLDAASCERIVRLLEALGLPVRLPRAVTPAEVWAACQIDKKVQSGAVHFVLLDGIGRTARVSDVTEEEVAVAMQRIRPA